jgi:hypothetical protein
MDLRPAREGTHTQREGVEEEESPRRPWYVCRVDTMSQAIAKQKIYSLHYRAEAVKRPENFLG